MSQTQEKKHVQDAPSEKSNRVQIGLLSRALARPEIGALVAAIVIGIFFLVVAPPFRSAESLSTVLYQSATIGIVAVGVGMLMIGGEFDLSAGVMVATAGLFASMFSYQNNLNLWIGALLSLAFALAIGFLNGYLVMKTGIASFLITLGTFFILQGANLGVTKLVTGSVSTPNINQMNGYTSLEKIFASSFQIGSVRVASSWSGGSRSSPLPPGCCCAPRSETGSTPWAATRQAHAQWASLWSGSRSACS